MVLDKLLEEANNPGTLASRANALQVAIWYLSEKMLSISQLS